jgi:hypothetical protein
MGKEPQLKKRITVPPNLDAEERLAVAEGVIEFIKQRTDKGLDVNGNRFAPYSESYVESKDFELADKSKNEVNLRLTDEMMESMQVIDSGRGFITIGFESGTEANDKAVWQQRSDNGPSRQFLGIAEKDLELVLAKTTVAEKAINEAAGSLASRILRGLGLG